MKKTKNKGKKYAVSPGEIIPERQYYTLCVLWL